MKFSEKLYELRKQNNMSQEQLAEKLGVSRQAVSKWESGASYPEMDKLLVICKIFNCSLDVLTNDTIMEFEEEKKGFTNYVDRFLATVNKIFTMFSKMKFTSIIQLFFELLLLFFVIFIFKETIIDMLVSLVVRLFDILPSSVANIFNNIIYFIVDFAYIIVSLIILGYIFNKRYLENYHDDGKFDGLEFKEKEAAVEMPEKEIKTVETEIAEDNTKYVYVTKNNFSIIGAIAKCCLWFLKFIVFWCLLTFIFIFFGLVVALIIDICLMVKGVTVLGILLCIIFSIVLTILLLVGCSNFIFNKRTNYKIVLLSFLVGIGGLGVGVAITGIEFSQFKYVDEYPEEFQYVYETKNYEMNDNLFIDYFDVKYIVDESYTNEIKIEMSNNDFLEVRATKYDSDRVDIYYGSDVNFNKLINVIVEGLKNKTIYNMDFSPQVRVYASWENIQKLKDNYDSYWNELHESEMQDMVNQYERKLREYESLIYEYQVEINDLENRVVEYEEEINNYESKLQELEDLLGR